MGVLVGLAVGGLAVVAGCGQSNDRPPTSSSSPPAAPTTTVPAARPKPEDSAIPGPLPKPGAPQKENPTGTGTGR